MSRFLKTSIFITSTCITLSGTVAFAQDAAPSGVKYDLGRAADTAEVAAWDTDIRPDGLGLPKGKGNVEDGEVIFSEKCASCHGDFGEAVDRWPVLAGGQDTLTSERPVKTIGSYWPYLSTVYDYIHRAMPFGDARTLTHDEVYAITAYILYLNDLVEDDFELSDVTFNDVTMPNKPNFFMDDRPTTEYPLFSKEACTENCKEMVEITGRAQVVDVTPNETAAKAAEKTVVEETITETVVVAPTATLDEALVASGKKVFKKCKACHKIGEGAKNSTGPQLNDVMGRIAGSIEGFKYSKGMIAAGDDGMVWDVETLRPYLTKPRAVIKRTKMSFSGLKKEKDLDAVIEYLKSFSGK